MVLPARMRKEEGLLVVRFHAAVSVEEFVRQALMAYNLYGGMPALEAQDATGFIDPGNPAPGAKEYLLCEKETGMDLLLVRGIAGHPRAQYLVSSYRPSEGRELRALESAFLCHIGANSRR